MTGVRSPLLAALLRLLPSGAGGGWRALEIGTDPQAGASAAELADRSGGPVVSVSRSSHVIARARLARATHPQLSFHRQIPLAAGWPAAAPYDLVLSWELMDAIPNAWLAQCAPGARLLSPVFLPRPAPARVGVLRLIIGQDGVPQSPPTVALVRSGSGPNGPLQWEIRQASLESAEDDYLVSCGAGRSWLPAGRRA